METKSLKLDKLLLPYQEQIKQAIKAHIPLLGPKNLLREACEYALLNGGKRIRPAFVLMLGKALGGAADVMPAALAIEFFHSASLVADDLPCMDDDDERRNKPSVHKKYGENLAILVSYALIAAGYNAYVHNARLLQHARLPHSPHSEAICVLTLENATYNTGLNGATGGQFLDISPPDLSLETLREVMHKKTVSLFEISFVSGWLYGGGKISALPLVKKAASHFGMAFQLLDDIQDMQQDALNERFVNMAAVKGLEATENMIRTEIALYKQTLTELGIALPEMFEIVDLI